MKRNKVGSTMLTLREAARVLSAHANTVRRWTNDGRLHTLRIGPRGDRRFRPEELRRFLIEEFNRSDLL
jgi:excisionase family DNA binding protein